MKSICNFFKKVWAFIVKYSKIAWSYVKENAWLQPIIIVALIFGLVFDDNVMEEICANNPPTITEDQIDKMFMSRNRFEARHRNGTVTYYTGGNITKAKPIVFMPRSYFRSTPFMDNYLSKKFELGILPEDAVEYLEWRRDASIHYPIDTA